MLLRHFRRPMRSRDLLRARTQSTIAVDGVTIVRTVADALRVAEIITKLPLDTVHAWDTEVIDIDLDTQSPVGHGTVICASLFSGENIDYGTGPSVWIDAYGEQKLEVLLAFRQVLESSQVRKVWHNYGFDRHVLGNHGIETGGFWADTMHMARLHNSSRDKMGLGGYSLAKLSEHFVEKRGLAPAKTSMLDLFGVPVKKKDGTDGKKKELPPLDQLQTAEDPALVSRWIQYSCLDARVTWHLYNVLREELSRPGDATALWRPAPQCFHDIQFDSVNAMQLQPGQRDTEAHPPVLWELYERVHRPFGQLLTDMERRGMLLHQGQIASATAAAQAERDAIIERFKAWAAAFTGQPDMHLLNVHSDQQKAQFLFGLPPPAPPPAPKPKQPGKAGKAKAAKEKEEQEQEQEDSLAGVPMGLSAPELDDPGPSPVAQPTSTDAQGEKKKRRKKKSKKQGDEAGTQADGGSAEQLGSSALVTTASLSSPVSWRQPSLSLVPVPVPCAPFAIATASGLWYGRSTRHAAHLLPPLLCGLLRWFSTETWAANIHSKGKPVALGDSDAPPAHLPEGEGEGGSSSSSGSSSSGSSTTSKRPGQGGTGGKGSGKGTRRRQQASSIMLEEDSNPALAAFDRIHGGDGSICGSGAAAERGCSEEEGGDGGEHGWSIGLGYSSSSDSDTEVALQVALAANDSEMSSSSGSEESGCEGEGEGEEADAEGEGDGEGEGEGEATASLGGHRRGKRPKSDAGDVVADPAAEDEDGRSLLSSLDSDSEDEGGHGGEGRGGQQTVGASITGPVMGGYKRPPPPPVLPTGSITAKVATESGVGTGAGGIEVLAAEYEFETDNTDKWTPPDKPARVDKKSGETVYPKKRPFVVPSLFLPITERTPKGRASGTAASIKKLLGKPLEEGVAYKHLVSHGCAPEAAKEACSRIQDLLALSAVDTVLETFLLPLATAAANDRESRVHCSLNLNTETGRLSARRPNLQNQPSLERDKFKIRSAFIAPPGKCFVVADYGQLELRVLAHLTGCKSMIEAFKLGGDFHSRTAMGMYKHVKAAVDGGEVLLEWPEDGSAGPPPKPLLKDKFKEERRKAKILNFSIAYGKTAFGLSKDWGVSLPEAEETVRAWYADRPEVERWQVDTKANARNKKPHRVYTILGRHRDLPGINERRLRNHLERAAINTPIQGSAADIVMCAMLRLARDEQLTQRLGFHQVLQVHDEVVLEGPQEHGQQALSRVVDLMGRPFDAPLAVDLAVDAKVVRSWGDAK